MNDFDCAWKYLEELVYKYGILNEKDIISAFAKNNLTYEQKKNIIRKLEEDEVYISFIEHKDADDLIGPEPLKNLKRTQTRGQKSETDKSSTNNISQKKSEHNEKEEGPKKLKTLSLPRYYPKESSEKMRLQRERLFEQILDEYPCFKGLMSEEILLSRNEHFAFSELKGRFRYNLSSEQKMAMKTSVLFDVFIYSYQRAKKYSLDFEELLSEAWMIACNIAESYSPFSEYSLNDYVVYQLSRKQFKNASIENSLPDEREGYVCFGAYEDICNERLITTLFISRRKTPLEEFMDRIEALVETSSLEERDKKIMFDYFGFYGKPQSDDNIGRKLKLTRSRIQQIRKRSLLVLRRRLYKILKSEYRIGFIDRLKYDDMTKLINETSQ